MGRQYRGEEPTRELDSADVGVRRPPLRGDKRRARERVFTIFWFVICF